MIRKTCHFAGHVQGVGFRYTAQNIAAKAGLSGYVRNLPDGRVEVVMEGDEPEINRALNDIQRHAALSRIDGEGMPERFWLA